MALTVYSMGDMPIFTSVLNGVAMIFNSSLFDANQGAGVVVMGFILALIFMILPALSTGKLDAKPFIFVFILYYGGIVPRERLQVEDVYSGAVTAVDNIPLIIALPASIGASLSKSMTDVVETAASTTSGSYLTLGAEGFVNPLKMLLSLRDPIMAQRTFPFINASVMEFVRYCAPSDTTFNVKAMSSSPNIVNYLAGLNTTGLMTYFNSGAPQGVAVSCTDGINKLNTDSQLIALKSNYEIMVKTATAGEFPKSTNASSQGATTAGITQAYNSITSGILSNLQDAQSFMINAIVLTSANQGIDCINQPSGPNLSQCMSEVMTREALERSNIDASGQTGVFVKTVIPASNMLLALFYALSPIVLAIAFFSGAQHGLKVLMGFLIFGISMQCWMPIAAIINYMIQMQTQYAFSSFPTSGMTMENYMVFYNILSTKIGLASNLMVTVQSLTFALMSGSMFALSGLSNSMSSKDYMDEGKVAPKVSETSAALQKGALIDGGTTQHHNPNTGATVTTGLEPGQIAFTGVTKNSAGDRASITDGASKNLAATLSNNLSRQGSSGINATTLASFGRNVMTSHVEGSEFMRNIADEITDGERYSDVEKEEIIGTIALAAGAGLKPEQIVLRAQQAKDAIRARTPTVERSVKGDGGVRLAGGHTNTKTRDLGKAHKNALALSDKVSNSRNSSTERGLVNNIMSTKGFQEIYGDAQGYEAATSAIHTAQVAQEEASVRETGTSFVRTLQIDGLAQLINDHPKLLARLKKNVEKNPLALPAAQRLNGLQNVVFDNPNNREAAIAANMAFLSAESGDSVALDDINETLFGLAKPKSNIAQAAQREVGAEPLARDTTTPAIKPPVRPKFVPASPSEVLPPAPTKSQAHLAGPLKDEYSAGPASQVYAQRYKQQLIEATRAYSNLVQGTGGTNPGNRLFKAMKEGAWKNPALVGAASLAASGTILGMVEAAQSMGEMTPQKARNAVTTAAGFALAAQAIQEGMNGQTGEAAINGAAAALMMSPHPVAKAAGVVLGTSYHMAQFFGAEEAGHWLGGKVYDLTHGDEEQRIAVLNKLADETEQRFQAMSPAQQAAFQKHISEQLE